MSIKMSINRGPIHILSWTEDFEEGAQDQAANLSNLPFAFHHIAIMPDVHQGYGMPIGGVMATRGVVVPNAVGVDIGCGMRACKTDILIENFDKDTLKRIMGKIRQSVPVGFKKHSEGQVVSRKLDDALHNINHDDSVCWRHLENAFKSLGTLGGGNHFIEFQAGSDGFIWVMVHSGSRNLGNQVANFYNKKAIELNEKMYTMVPKAWQLAFLPMDSDITDLGWHYIDEMNFCVEYAKQNRKLMMDRIKISICSEVIGAKFDTDLDVAHNYARYENHYGKNVYVHRKGATSARKDELGIIPGSQGTASFIVKGLGNEKSFCSCSHGSGRVLSRKKCKSDLNLAEQKEILDSQGIVHGLRSEGDLDEAPGAYKDITEVMENQNDLVKEVIKLLPIGVLKG